jgi:hypothetical protein
MTEKKESFEFKNYLPLAFVAVLQGARLDDTEILTENGKSVPLFLKSVQTLEQTYRESDGSLEPHFHEEHEIMCVGLFSTFDGKYSFLFYRFPFLANGESTDWISVDNPNIYLTPFIKPEE